MNIHKRLFARHASIVTDPDHPIVDVGGLALRLLLFEKLIFDSMLLAEFPTLVRVFGMKGVMELLSSGAVDVQCEAVCGGAQHERQNHEMASFNRVWGYSCSRSGFGSSRRAAGRFSCRENST
jgi:hypothetical protein